MVRSETHFQGLFTLQTSYNFAGGTLRQEFPVVSQRSLFVADAQHSPVK